MECSNYKNEGSSFKDNKFQNPLWACSALSIYANEIILIGGKNTNRHGEVHMFNIHNKTWK